MSADLRTGIRCNVSNVVGIVRYRIATATLVVVFDSIHSVAVLVADWMLKDAEYAISIPSSPLNLSLICDNQAQMPTIEDRLVGFGA